MHMRDKHNAQINRTHTTTVRSSGKIFIQLASMLDDFFLAHTMHRNIFTVSNHWHTAEDYYYDHSTTEVMMRVRAESVKLKSKTLTTVNHKWNRMWKFQHLRASVWWLWANSALKYSMQIWQFVLFHPAIRTNLRRKNGEFDLNAWIASVRWHE